MSINIEKLAWHVVAIVYTFLWMFSSVHDFHLWSQVTFLQGSTPDFSRIYTQAHFLRYLLVYPIFVAGDTFSLDTNEIFNALCFVMLFYISKNCVKTSQYYLKYNVLVSALFFTFIFVTVSAFMNGRILFAFLGFSYLIVTVHRWELHRLGNRGLFIRLFIVLLLCSVSSGTFLLCIIFLLAWSVVTIQRRKKALYPYIALLMIVLGPIISLYIFKNADFYGGGVAGVVNMLQHGAGIIFYTVDLDLLILTCINLIFFLFFSVVLYLHAKNHQLLLGFLGCSIVCGLFGFSTLSLGIIPFSILFILVLEKLFHLKTPSISPLMCQHKSNELGKRPH